MIRDLLFLLLGGSLVWVVVFPVRYQTRALRVDVPSAELARVFRRRTR